MDIDHVTDASDGIVELLALDERLLGQVRLSAHTAGLAHADVVGHRVEAGLLEAGHFTAEQGDELAHLPVRLDLGLGEFHAIGAGLVDHARGVEVDDILFEPGEPEHILARALDAALGLGTVVDRRDLAGRGHPCAIHMTELEAQRHRLGMAGRAALLDLAAGHGAQVRIAGGVDEQLALHGREAALGEQHRGRDAGIAHQHIRKLVVIKQVNPGFEAKVLGREHGRLFADVAILQRADLGIKRLVGRAVALHPADPLEIHRLIQALAVEVVRHERVHFAVAGHAAQSAIAFHQHDTRTLAGCHDRRREPARTTTDHDNIRLAHNRDRPGLLVRHRPHSGLDHTGAGVRR